MQAAPRSRIEARRGILPFPPEGTQGKHYLHFKIFDLQKCKIMNLYCFKPLSLRSFVTATIRNKYSWRQYLILPPTPTLKWIWRYWPLDGFLPKEPEAWMPEQVSFSQLCWCFHSLRKGSSQCQLDGLLGRALWCRLPWIDARENISMLWLVAFREVLILTQSLYKIYL